MKEGSRTDKKRVLLLLFIVTAVVQIAVSAGMIISREITIRSGKEYKFRTEPVDPYDAFRGRYVALSVEGSSALFGEGEEYTRRQTVYAVIEEDKQGFARITRVQPERPDHDNYIKAKIGRVYKNAVSLNLPFNRFYMDEFEAPKAEAAYRTSGRKEGFETYITVRVHSGNGVIEGLYIDDKHIREYVKK